MDGSEKARRRREEAARLRQVANSAAPRAYQDPKKEALKLEDLDPNDNNNKGMDNTTFGNVVDLYGAFTQDDSWRTRPISTAVSMSSYALAYILLLIVLSVAQCSWWYEPGMYSDRDPSVVSHGR